jgi:homocitrate synthase (EC 2.3.3.14)
VEYDIHAHNDLGMAVANSLAAVEGGATIIHATVNGLGERVGITPLQAVAAAIKYHFGIDVVKLDLLPKVAALIEKYIDAITLRKAEQAAKYIAASMRREG